MPGRSTAVDSGVRLEDRVAVLATSLGLEVRKQVRVGQRLWGAVRKIDVILTNPLDRRRLGVECKYQGQKGTAEEKIPSTIEDIAAWPIPGIVVFAGEGFSNHWRFYLVASGKAVAMDDLEAWLRLFFGLDLE